MELLRKHTQDLEVLYVEDDTESREQMYEILEMLFSKIIVAKDGEEAYNLYKKNSFDIVITDLYMPKKDGLTLAKDIKGLIRFLNDYPQAEKGFVITLGKQPSQINEKILALPWYQLRKILGSCQLLL